eukprot:CAMPEP_0194171884 /NCGR_PEP_ID=MMETSP0154-20130528/6435_1 /TAXON_ID=1049557 /ORGANISM="Thalassiothrix antarctica, Strain L6-D1" /LENGTH=621 /DNA_ID=CAMNT_0038884377 /DNA_START=57 /DNA_END=1922 /DNA_ORIENTATION=-
MESELVDVSLESATLRHIQTAFPKSIWSEKTLKNIGINQGGRALLVLELGKLAKSEQKLKDPPVKSNLDTKMSIAATEDILLNDDVEMPGANENNIEMLALVENSNENSIESVVEGCIPEIMKNYKERILTSITKVSEPEIPKNYREEILASIAKSSMPVIAEIYRENNVRDNLEVSKNDVEKTLCTLLECNFDVDTKICIITLLKIIGNILQQPENPKVRSIRLSNAAFSKKVVERKGGIEFLLACGFQLKEEAPKLLSGSETCEKQLVLTKENEDTSHIIEARRLLVLKATTDLGMNAEDLPKFKPPPFRTYPRGQVARGSFAGTTSGEFNPYKGVRFDAKSAAIGKQLGPDKNYRSTTEKKVEELQLQQDKLENSMHNEITDREINAFLPTTVSVIPDSDVAGSNNGPSDGVLLARQIQRREQEKKQREDGGFTTKAMRDLQKLKRQKVYSHAQLRIQFSDGSAITARFLPREKIDAVRKAVKGALLNKDLDFDLYVAPPRRKLNFTSTLEQEGLVPAAKVFLSWKSNAAPGKQMSPGTFLKAELFQDGCAPSYPSSQTLVGKDSKDTSQNAKVSRDNDSSREEDLLSRMLGKAGRKKPKKNSVKKVALGNKPKWFKK